MSKRVLRLDDPGLNLVLGGGINVVKRHPQLADESATMVVRGPPGSGKTCFGVSVAGMLARSLQCDVAYACVEFLPSELDVQHRSIKPLGASERVVVGPFEPQGPRGEECRIFAASLDLEGKEGELHRFMDAVEELLGAATDAGGAPRVLVVDSLTDGYHLGASVPRPFADNLAKMAAERGMVLILLEEAIDTTPSVWCFSADIVIELSIGASELYDESRHLRLAVMKNRFGPMDPGPHRLEIGANVGVVVFPDLSAFVRPWAIQTLFPAWDPKLVVHGDWGELRERAVELVLPSFASSTTIVFGQYADQVPLVAVNLGGVKTPSFLFSFGAEPDGSWFSRHESANLVVAPVGMLYRPGHIVSRALISLARFQPAPSSLGCVYAGDLARLVATWGLDELWRPLGVVVTVMKRMGVPLIMVQSGEVGVTTPLQPLADVAVRAVDPITIRVRTGPLRPVDFLSNGSAMASKLAELM